MLLLINLIISWLVSSLLQNSVPCSLALKAFVPPYSALLQVVTSHFLRLTLSYPEPQISPLLHYYM